MLQTLQNVLRIQYASSCTLVVMAVVAAVVVVCTQRLDGALMHRGGWWFETYCSEENQAELGLRQGRKPCSLNTSWVG